MSLRWCGDAFGLALWAADPVFGTTLSLARAREEPRRRRVDLVPAPPRELRDRWRSGARPAGGVHEGGRRSVEMLSHPDRGWLLRAEEVGTFELSGDGRRVRYAPARAGSWAWRALLSAQALPFASVLQGMEPLHAAGLVVDGRGIAISGPSGSGKSSTAVHLLLGGAALLADDVLALEATAEGVLAHPASGLVGLGLEDDGRLTRAERSQLGPQVGNGAKVHRAPSRLGAATPLRCLYLLQRTEAFAGIELQRDTAPPLPTLMATSFNRVVRAGDRPARQLDLFGRLATEVPVVHVRCGRGTSARETAAAVAAHASGLAA